MQHILFIKYCQKEEKTVNMYFYITANKEIKCLLVLQLHQHTNRIFEVKTSWSLETVAHFLNTALQNLDT